MLASAAGSDANVFSNSLTTYMKAGWCVCNATRWQKTPCTLNQHTISAPFMGPPLSAALGLSPGPPEGPASQRCVLGILQAFMKANSGPPLQIHQLLCCQTQITVIAHRRHPSIPTNKAARPGTMRATPCCRQRHQQLTQLSGNVPGAIGDASSTQHTCWKRVGSDSSSAGSIGPQALPDAFTPYLNTLHSNNSQPMAARSAPATLDQQG
jgi:hypothetical protein